MRTSNKIERLNKELKRRMKVIGRHPDENGCMTLIDAVSKKYAASQRHFSTGDLEIKLWQRLRDEKIFMIKQLELDERAA